MDVPLVDLAWQHAEVEQQVLSGWHDVLAAGDFIQGEQVDLFEREFAAFSNVRHCIGVNSGTDALELALRAAGVGRGDEVLVPVNTFAATAMAVTRLGALVRLVDVDDVTYNVTPELVAAAISPRTRAVIPVHLYGQAADIEGIRAAAGSDLVVIVDAAQAHGVRTRGGGVLGGARAAATSFYPSKNLGAYGDAGAVLTDDDDVAAAVRSFRNYGRVSAYEHPTVGANSRLDTLQAVVLRAKLERLADWNRRRAAAAAIYTTLLAGVAGVTTPVAVADHVWHLYVVRVAGRDRMLDALHAGGIGAAVHYPTPLHLQGAFRALGHGAGDFPVAEAHRGELLSLPLFPGITPAQQEHVVATIRAVR